MTAVLSGEKWGELVEGGAGGVLTWSLAGAGIDLSHFEVAALDEPDLDVVDLTTSLNPNVAYSTFNVEARLREAFAAWSAVSNV
ncbi:MAG: hypothetical protein AAGI70_04035, partial [Pseudomonadota bacterium]